MMKKINVWNLNSFGAPKNDGVYEVRLTKVDSLIDSEIETIMEFRNGEWLLRVPAFINEYKVSAWKEMN